LPQVLIGTRRNQEDKMTKISRLAPRSKTARRGTLVAGVAAVALAATGAAFGWHGGFGSATLTSATFYANTVSNSQSQTCTAGNDSIQITDATYTGTASSSDTHLTGPVTLKVESVYDATTKAGTVTGSIQIAGSPAGFTGWFTTVNANGNLQGLLYGSESGGGQLLANLSSAFTTGGGFASSGTQAAVGSGTAANTAILSTSSCTSSGHGDNDNDDDNGNGNGNWNKGSFGKLGGNLTGLLNSLKNHHGGND
jgi:hypothetical protein